MMRNLLCVVGMIAAVGVTHAKPKMTPEKLLENVVDALGGKKFRKMTTLSSSGRMRVIGADLQGTCSIHVKAPGMSRMTVRVTDMMESTEGCDGTIAWDYNPFFAVIRVKDPKESAYMILHSRTDLLTEYEKHFSEWVIVRQSQVNGHACHVLKLTPKNGVQPFFYHIDVTSFLIRREESVFDGPQGRFSITSDIDEYKKVNGVNVPQKLTIGMSQMKIKVVFDSITVNAPLPDALFVNPDEMTLAIRQTSDLVFEVGAKDPVIMTRKELLDALKIVNSVKDDFTIKTITLTGAKGVEPKALLASSYWLRNLATTVKLEPPSTVMQSPVPVTESTEPKSVKKNNGEK